MSAAFVVVFSLFAAGMLVVATLIVRSAVRRDRARNRARRAGADRSVGAARIAGGSPPPSQ